MAPTVFTELVHYSPQAIQCGCTCCGSLWTALWTHWQCVSVSTVFPGGSLESSAFSSTGPCACTAWVWVDIVLPSQVCDDGGLGIVLGRTSHELLIGVERLSHRIMEAWFRGNPDVSIIVTYVPTEAADDQTNDIYIKQLCSAIEGVPLHDFLAVLTDANARLELDSVLFSYKKITRGNGKRHLDIMEEYQLLAANTLFQNRSSKLWTWRSPQNTHHQLDYILIWSKWRSCVTNCKAYSSFGSLYTDHRVITANVALCLHKSGPSSNKVSKYIWSDLVTNNELQERYVVAIGNRYQLLLDADGNHQDQDYDKFVLASPKCLRSVLDLP